MMHDHETAKYGSTNLDFFISSKGMKERQGNQKSLYMKVEEYDMISCPGRCVGYV